MNRLSAAKVEAVTPEPPMARRRTCGLLQSYAQDYGLACQQLWRLSRRSLLAREA